MAVDAEGALASRSRHLVASCALCAHHSLFSSASRAADVTTLALHVICSSAFCAGGPSASRAFNVFSWTFDAFQSGARRTNRFTAVRCVPAELLRFLCECARRTEERVHQILDHRACYANMHSCTPAQHWSEGAPNGTEKTNLGAAFSEVLGVLSFDVARKEEGEDTDLAVAEAATQLVLPFLIPVVINDVIVHSA